MTMPYFTVRRRVRNAPGGAPWHKSVWLVSAENADAAVEAVRARYRDLVAADKAAGLPRYQPWDETEAKYAAHELALPIWLEGGPSWD